MSGQGHKKRSCQGLGLVVLEWERHHAVWVSPGPWTSSLSSLEKDVTEKDSIVPVKEVKTQWHTCVTKLVMSPLHRVKQLDGKYCDNYKKCSTHPAAPYFVTDIQGPGQILGKNSSTSLKSKTPPSRDHSEQKKSTRQELRRGMLRRLSFWEILWGLWETTRWNKEDGGLDSKRGIKSQWLLAIFFVSVEVVKTGKY